jgi:hypothetical protein
VLQEIRVRHEAEAKRPERLVAGGKGVGDPVEMRALGRLRRQLAEMAPNRVQLPQEPLLLSAALRADEQPIQEPEDEIGAERQAGGAVPLARVLRSRPLQERGIVEDVGQRLQLPEELLRCEQIDVLPARGMGVQLVSPADRPHTRVRNFLQSIA